MNSARVFNTYLAYGLCISAELPCPELLPSRAVPQVTIRFAPVPDSLPEATVRGVRFEAAPDRFLLKVDGVARFLVSRGEEVLIEPAPGAREDDIRVFLLGSVMGALLHQRGRFVLHGSAILSNGHASVFSGLSGAGKSTLAAAFLKKGCPVLSDDISLVDFAEGGMPEVCPGYPQLKLWADAAGRLRYRVETLRRLRLYMDKYGLPLEEGFSSVPAPLSRLYVLSLGNGPRIEVREITGRKKVGALLDHTYRFRFLEAQGIQRKHFEQCALAARNLTVKEVSRPRGEDSLQEVVERIERDLSQ